MDSGSTERAETPPPPSPAAAGDDRSAAAEAAGGLLSRVRRAGALSLVSYVGSQLIRLAGNIALTHLLFEEAFGLMALVGVVVQGLQLFSDIGVGPSLVQSKRGEEPAFQDTAFTLQAARGAILCLLACAGAVPLAQLYGRAELRMLLPAAGFTALIAGFNSTKLFTQNRTLSMGRLAILEIATQVVTLTSMVVWALHDRSVWALVCGAVVMNATYMLLSHVLLPGRNNRFQWDRGCARELFGFGRWIFLSTALTFLAGQSDRLIFGKLVSMRVLGVYNIAYSLAQMPSSALGHLASTVVFPLFSRMFESSPDVQRTFHDVRRPLLLLAGWLSAGVIAGGPVIIELLYDQRFRDAGWMLQVLAFGGWFAFLEYTIVCALLAAGRTRAIALGAGSRLVAIAVTIPAGYALAGFPGAVCGFALADVVRLIVSTIAARPLGLRDFGQDLAMTGRVALSALVGAAACAAVATRLDPGLPGTLVKVLAIAAAVSLSWLPAALSYRSSRRRSARG